MALEVVKPRMRGFVGTSAHPTGCARMVDRQIAAARNDPAAWRGGKLLVIGSSTGYGLASRITGAFRYGMDSVGVFYERPATERRTASAGWYNAAAFDRSAREAPLSASSINGDAFSREVLEQTMARVRDELGAVDVLVYSLAAPIRVDPETGETHRSVLKTVRRPFTTKSIDLLTDSLKDVTLEPATDDEIASTVAVMGGADLERWVSAFADADLLAPGARVVAYSYIGPEVTWPIYRNGTIGRAKADLEVTCAALHERLQRRIGGSCRVSINKSIVSQASAAIPAVPLYMSLLFRVMKDKGLHEGPIEQAVRLFDGHICSGRGGEVDDDGRLRLDDDGRIRLDEDGRLRLDDDGRIRLDEDGRIRLDDVEMRPDIQAEVMRRWELVNEDNFREVSDYDGYLHHFHNLFGFEVLGVAYDVPVETDVPLAV